MRGTYYMLSEPTVTCWEGQHLAAVLLSMFQFLTLILGWPIQMFVIYYVGSRCHLLLEPDFRKMFGWLYWRFEIEYYWWHAVIVFQKFAIVVLKVL